MNKRQLSDFKNIIFIVIGTFILFLVLHAACNSSIIGHSAWDSYELQAQAWLEGRTDLGDVDKVDYYWLELAIFQGKYYVSFPPLPSVIFLPLVMIFSYIPNNFIIYCIVLITCIVAYYILRKLGSGEISSIIYSIGYVFGSNMVFMAMNGGVWFIAQALNMLFCTLAVGYFLENKRDATYTCLACAVGCRPFSAIYIVGVFIFYLIKDKDKNKKIKDFIQNDIIPLLPMIIIAILYMTYNYMRFRNPLEFGHNYLPEFTSSEHGQFNLVYLITNIKGLLIIDSTWNSNFARPFNFLLANPFFIVSIYLAIKNIKNTRTISKTRLIFLVSMFINIILICLHKTLGGLQFGARYTCDLLPFAFLCTLIQINKDNGKDKNKTELLLDDETPSPIKVDTFQLICLVFAIVLNIYGTIVLWNSR